MIGAYTYRLDFEDGTFEIVETDGFDYEDAKARVREQYPDATFITTVGSRGRNPIRALVMFAGVTA